MLSLDNNKTGQVNDIINNNNKVNLFFNLIKSYFITYKISLKIT